MIAENFGTVRMSRRLFDTSAGQNIRPGHFSVIGLAAKSEERIDKLMR